MMIWTFQGLGGSMGVKSSLWQTLFAYLKREISGPATVPNSGGKERNDAGPLG